MPPDDPIYNNLAAREAERMSLPNIDSTNRGAIQRQQNIKPGTEAWFQLWFKGARWEQQNLLENIGKKLTSLIS